MCNSGRAQEQHILLIVRGLRLLPIKEMVSIKVSFSSVEIQSCLAEALRDYEQLQGRLTEGGYTLGRGYRVVHGPTFSLSLLHFYYTAILRSSP